VRKLLVLSLLVALAGTSFLTATAAARDDISRAPTPEFAEDVPRLLPMTRPDPAATSAPASRGDLDADALAAIAALYWLVLGGVALRRSRRTGALLA
jgi:hypothetical protein